MSAKSDMSQLVRMMPLAVVIPSIASLGMVLPPSGRTGGKDHRPFANLVTIAKMEDRIDVMVSMQKPKKVRSPHLACHHGVAQSEEQGQNSRVVPITELELEGRSRWLSGGVIISEPPVQLCCGLMAA